MIDASTLVPTWGYRPNGSAQIFELKAGAALHDGWHATPDCIEDRSLATADALTEAAARSAKAANARPAAARTEAAPLAVPPAMAERALACGRRTPPSSQASPRCATSSRPSRARRPRRSYGLRA